MNNQSVSLPLVANGTRVVVLIVALIIVAGVAFAAGSFVRAPQQSALDAAGDHLEVTHPVEERVVAAGVELPGRVIPGSTVRLETFAGGGKGDEGASRSIVTQSTLAVGQVVNTGTLLGEVSGRPLIAIPQGVPLYRDLVDGSTGADVSDLQSALAQLGLDVSSTGEVGSRTLAAVAELYTRAGIESSDETTIRWAELLPVAPGAVVVSVSPVGTVLSEEAPLATVKVSLDVIVTRATVLEADELEVGQAVEVRAGGATAQSTVVGVGEFTSTDQGSGRDITVGIPPELTITESEPVTVATDDDAEPSPAVPTVALRQDVKGTYVELPGADERERVYVTVVAQSGGWSAIAPDDRLPAGTPVVVSP